MWKVMDGLRLPKLMVKVTPVFLWWNALLSCAKNWRKSFLKYTLYLNVLVKRPPGSFEEADSRLVGNETSTHEPRNAGLLTGRRDITQSEFRNIVKSNTNTHNGDLPFKPTFIRFLDSCRLIFLNCPNVIGLPCPVLWYH